MVKFCQRCGAELVSGYKWCSDCKKTRKRIYAKQRYKTMKEAGTIKRFGTTNCIYCGKIIVKNTRNQEVCIDCYREHHHKSVDNYNTVKRAKNGKATIGRQTVLDLGLIIDKLVVHHINENPNDNRLSNLIVLNRSNHAALHQLLEKNWSLLLKGSSSNLENCWNTLRDQLTTAYLETKSANVIKITDIGQSAAEPLNKENIYIFDLQEESSETMHQVPKSSNTQGKDIVQTQTTM